ncbi:MAG TPA: hypothetical protein VE995_02890 [Gaiellaceae bacterium]|nr:hypothetical protein [Gaiellaceae bacterium]
MLRRWPRLACGRSRAYRARPRPAPALPDQVEIGPSNLRDRFAEPDELPGLDLSVLLRRPDLLTRDLRRLLAVAAGLAASLPEAAMIAPAGAAAPSGLRVAAQCSVTSGRAKGLPLAVERRTTRRAIAAAAVEVGRRRHAPLGRPRRWWRHFLPEYDRS